MILHVLTGGKKCNLHAADIHKQNQLLVLLTIMTASIIYFCCKSFCLLSHLSLLLQLQTNGSILIESLSRSWKKILYNNNTYIHTYNYVFTNDWKMFISWSSVYQTTATYISFSNYTINSIIIIITIINAFAFGYILPQCAHNKLALTVF